MQVKLRAEIERYTGVHHVWMPDVKGIPVLCVENDEGMQECVEHYDPFVDEPALFYRFAELAPEPDAILRFANEYGKVAGLALQQEDWRKLIAEMKRAVEVWQAFRRHPTPTLSQRLHDFIDSYCDLVDVKFALSHDRGPALTVTVYELIHALWLQFAMAVTEAKDFDHCDWCSRAFQVSAVRRGRRGRNDRRFCTVTCRVNSYRNRKAKALTMRAEGKKLREIAKEVGTDMNTLKKWLGEE